MIRFLDLLKTSLWNSLLLLASFVLCDKNDKKDEENINDIILLFSILELTSTAIDPSSLFFNNTKNLTKLKEFKDFIFAKNKYNKNKEHESLVQLYKNLSLSTKLSFNSLINESFFASIKQHYESTYDILYSQNFIKNNKLFDQRNDLFIKNNLLGLIDSKKMSKFDKIVLYSRYIYLCYPKKNAKGYSFITKNTLIPLEGKPLLQRENLDNHLCIFESASVIQKLENNNTKKEQSSKKEIADIRLLSTFPSLNV